MAAAGDLEKGAVMDPSPGERTDKALRNEEEGAVSSYLFKLFSHVGLYEFCAEQANPENERQETKKIWIVAIALLSLNSAVITTMPTTDGGLAQVVLILTTLSFLLTLILVLTPIAMPALRMLNIKRFVLVCAGIVTACSYLIYVANKMGRIAPSSIATIIASGLFVLFITILFLIQRVLGAPPLTLPHHSELLLAPGPSSLASAPPTGEGIP